MKARRFLLFTVFLLLPLLTGGCGVGEDHNAYLRTPFCAEVEGECAGASFTAEIGTCEDGFYVEFLQPSALSGIRAEQRGERCEVRLGELCIPMTASELSAWLEPLSLLAAIEPTRVRREGEHTVLEYGEGRVLVLNERGIPVRGEGKGVIFRVTWWQSLSNGA